ncbi:MAG: hypothetical protein Faunusvirus62_4, partial [Faunusvirus sp.]
MVINGLLATKKCKTTTVFVFTTNLNRDKYLQYLQYVPSEHIFADRYNINFDLIYANTEDNSIYDKIIIFDGINYSDLNKSKYIAEIFKNHS